MTHAKRRAFYERFECPRKIEPWDRPKKWPPPRPPKCSDKISFSITGRVSPPAFPAMQNIPPGRTFVTLPAPPPPTPSAFSGISKSVAPSQLGTPTQPGSLKKALIQALELGRLDVPRKKT
jgi:hypothetical protein